MESRPLYIFHLEYPASYKANGLIKGILPEGRQAQNIIFGGTI
jgi:hypothetical protein